MLVLAPLALVAGCHPPYARLLVQNADLRQSVLIPGGEGVAESYDGYFGFGVPDPMTDQLVERLRELRPREVALLEFSSPNDDDYGILCLARKDDGSLVLLTNRLPNVVYIMNLQLAASRKELESFLDVPLREAAIQLRNTRVNELIERTPSPDACKVFGLLRRMDVDNLITDDSDWSLDDGTAYSLSWFEGGHVRRFMSNSCYIDHYDPVDHPVSLELSGFYFQAKEVIDAFYDVLSAESPRTIRLLIHDEREWKEIEKARNEYYGTPDE